MRTRRWPQGRPFGVIVAAMLALTGLSGCSDGSTADSGTTVAADAAADQPLTREGAKRAFRQYVNNDDVARSADDERLALSWTDDGQALLTAAAFRKASFTGDPVPRYRYRKPRFYVPRLGGFPQWFAVSAERTTRNADDGDSDTRTALMVFIRREAEGRWRLSLSTLLEKGTDLPEIHEDGDGYAQARATFDEKLEIQPRQVPSMQATLAEEGPKSLVADVMETGEHTSGHAAEIKDEKRRKANAGFAYDSIFSSTNFPVFALTTSDGAALVMYALSRETLVFRKSDDVDRVPVPRAAAHLTERLILKEELSVVEMGQYAATVPAKDSGGKARIVAVDGAVAKATGE